MVLQSSSAWETWSIAINTLKKKPLGTINGLMQSSIQANLKRLQVITHFGGGIGRLVMQKASFGCLMLQTHPSALK